MASDMIKFAAETQKPLEPLVLKTYYVAPSTKNVFEARYTTKGPIINIDERLSKVVTKSAETPCSGFTIDPLRFTRNTVASDMDIQHLKQQIQRSFRPAEPTYYTTFKNTLATTTTTTTTTAKANRHKVYNF